MSDAPQSSKPRKRKRRFLRFSLRALLLFIAVVAVWLGIITNRANRQRRAVEAITELGGEVWYDYQKMPPRRPRSGHFFSVKAEMPGPEWLRNAVGDHYFITPIYISARKQAVIDQDGLAWLSDLPEIEFLSFYQVRLRDEDLAHLRHLTKLRQVLFGEQSLSSISEARSFEFLSRCPELEELVLECSVFGDEEAAYLAHATKMRGLFLYDTGIGDDGVAHFKDMQHLETLGLGRTKVGDAGLAVIDRIRCSHS